MAAVIVFYSFLFIFLVTAWEITVKAMNISPLVLVKPSEIYPVMIENAPIFFKQTMFTFHEVFFGWFWGNFSAVIFSVFIFESKKLVDFFLKLSVILNAIPIVALSAIVGGFIGTGPSAKIFIVSLMCFFPMFVASLTGFTRINENENKLIDSYGTGKIKRFVYLVFPNGLPLITQTLKINVVNAIFAAVVSEFFGAHGGIGPLILENKGLYNLPMIWGALIYVIMAGSFFYLTVELISKTVVFWQK